MRHAYLFRVKITSEARNLSILDTLISPIRVAIISPQGNYLRRQGSVIPANKSYFFQPVHVTVKKEHFQ